MIGHALDLQRAEQDPLRLVTCPFCSAEWVERQDSQTSPSGDGFGTRTTTYRQVVEGTPCDCMAKIAAREVAIEAARQKAADDADAAQRRAAFDSLPPVAAGTVVYLGAPAAEVVVGDGCRLDRREGRPAVLAMAEGGTFATLVGFPLRGDAEWYAG